MDPTSFAVGVIGLAGLVSTCIEAFQILRSIRAFDRDTEILFTKLDLERELFVQWAQQVGLLKKQKYLKAGESLFDRRTDLTIYRVLKEIRLLLREAGGMEGKYEECDRARKPENRKVQAAYGDGRVEGKKISFGRRFLWTVHGRDELKNHIDELGYFVGKLYQMIPSIEQRKATCRELKEAGANAATLSTLMLAGGHSERGSVSDDGDWSDLASEVASRAEQRIGGGRRRRDRDTESDGERERYPRRRRNDGQRHYSHRPRERSPSLVSNYSHRSPKSIDTSSSYRSSRSTLVDMLGDMVGSNPRPISSLR